MLTERYFAGRTDGLRPSNNAEDLLVEKVILLFTPPFDRGKLEPGYIKGYLPGIRENGGQYTHAATWVVQATAMLSQGDRAVELFDLLNPIKHAATPEETARYKVEPYIVAADLYSVAPHTGRGGWTWYTGSAGWLYRVVMEAILGFELQGEKRRLNPCISPGLPYSATLGDDITPRRVPQRGSIIGKDAMFIQPLRGSRTGVGLPRVAEYGNPGLYYLTPFGVTEAS
jgi:hypothetical protein